MKVVVIIPTYNERENIINLLTKLDVIRRSSRKYKVSFLIADDNSPDQTQNLVKEFAKTHEGVHLVSGKKEGLGRALLRAMYYASQTLKADVIAQIDADLSHDPAVFPEFLKAIDDGADFVVGSRYIPGGSIPQNWAPYRKIYSVIGNAIVRFGLGFTRVHDWTGGYRAFKQEYFEAIKHELSRYSGYVFQIAFLHKSLLRGAIVAEVPIHFTDRRFGHSKIAPGEYIRNVLLYVGRERLQSLRSGTLVKFLLVGMIGFVVNTLVLEILVGIGLHPVLGSATGAEFAIISNFILNNTWTFRSKKITGGRTFPKFLQFNFTSVGAIIIQAGSVWLGTLIWGLSSYRLFYVLGVGLGLIWNYTMYKRVIWKK